MVEWLNIGIEWLNVKITNLIRVPIENINFKIGDKMFNENFERDRCQCVTTHQPHINTINHFFQKVIPITVL